MKTQITTFSLISILLVLSACGKKEVEAPAAPEAVESTAADLTADAEAMVESVQEEAEAIIEEAQAEVEAIVEEAQEDVEEAIAEVTADAEAQMDAVVKEAEGSWTELMGEKPSDPVSKDAVESFKSMAPQF